MAAASTPVAERARKMASIVFQRLQEPGRQVAIASVMGVSESTVSRLKNDHLESLCELLAHAGLKIVDVERVCVDPDTYRALSHIAQKAMSQPDIAERLVMSDQ